MIRYHRVYGRQKWSDIIKWMKIIYGDFKVIDIDDGDIDGEIIVTIKLI